MTCRGAVSDPVVAGHRDGCVDWVDVFAKTPGGGGIAAAVEFGGMRLFQLFAIDQSA